MTEAMDYLILYLVFSLCLTSVLWLSLSNNGLYNALFMIVAYICSVMTLLFLDIDFPALLLLIVYIGAIAVLITIVIMTLPSKETENPTFLVSDLWFYKVSFFFMLILPIIAYFFNHIDFLLLYPFTFDLLEIFYNLFSSRLFINISYITEHLCLISRSLMSAIAYVMYIDYIVLFVFVALVLLVCMVGVIVITSQTKTPYKQPVLMQQVLRNYQS
jgi:NADH-quinone oxidoreductase subunit J